MIEYKKPYPTIKDIINGKSYDLVICRVRFYNAPPYLNLTDEQLKYGAYAGTFKVEDGKIIPIKLSGLCLFDETRLVFASEEWSNFRYNHALTIVI